MELLVCSLCQKSFKWQSGLSRHTKVFHKDSTCVCTVCGGTFKREDNLKRHMVSCSIEKSLTQSITESKGSTKISQKISKENGSINDAKLFSKLKPKNLHFPIHHGKTGVLENCVGMVKDDAKTLDQLNHKDKIFSDSEKLKEKYEANFNQSLRCFESQTSTLKSRIKTLTEELEMAKLAILSVGTRKPVYSPGKYVDSG